MRNIQQQAVPVVNNYYLNDWFSVVMPEAGTNLITNPSIEVDTTGYTLQGAGVAIARTLDSQRRGAYSLEITPAVGVASGAYFGTITTVTGEPYTFSIDIHGVAGHVYNLYFASNAGAMLGAPYEFIATGYWQRVSVTYVETAGAARRFYIVQDAGDTQVYYTDGWQVENKSHATTYIDGDLEGFVTGEVAYLWHGIKHASTSSRAATTRSGGRVIKLSEYGFGFLGMTNLGMPPIQNFSLPLNTGGSFYQNTIEGSRRFALIGDISGPNFTDISSFRKQLELAFSYNLTPYRQPLLLHFQETDDQCRPVGESVFIKCIYDGGLEGTTDNYNTEKLAIQFVSYDTQSIFAEGDKAIELGFKFPLGIGSIVKQEPSGLWDTLAGGVVAGVSIIADILQSSDGSLYLTGSFATIGGVAAANIAVYQNGAWAALGAGIDATGRCLEEGPDGRIYVGGDFANAGGAPAVRMAVWDPVGVAWAALGAGLDNSVTDIAFVANGDLIAIGSFLNVVAGIAVTRIARWTPATATWAAIGAGLNAVGSVIEREFSGNVVYIGGNFTTPANYICKLDTATDTYTAMGIGADTTVYGIGIDRNANVHIVGVFTLIGGITALGYGMWNGSQWSVPVDVVENASYSSNVSPLNGDLYLTRPGNVTLHVKKNMVQNYGLAVMAGKEFNGFTSFKDGSLFSYKNAAVAYANGIAKTSLDPFERTFNQKSVITNLANTALTYLFRSQVLNQDATIEKTILTGEVITITTNPLKAVSNFAGDFTSQFNPGSALNLADFGIRDLSVLIVESMDITNDGANQIEEFNMLENVNLTNTTAGRIYVEIVDDGAGDFHTEFYSDAARLVLVGHTASEAGIGGQDQYQDIIPDGANGLEGIVAYNNLSAADADIYMDVGILESYIKYNRYYSTLYEARY